jgi:sugar phosphate permease
MQRAPQIFWSLPTDLYDSRAVGTVAGIAGTGDGIGTMISTYVIRRVTDAVSFVPVIAVAAIVQCVATAVCIVRSPGDQAAMPRIRRMNWT